MDFLLDRICPMPADKLREFGWSDEGRSPNFVRQNAVKVCRKLAANSTDGIRGAKGIDSGLHIWEVRWPRIQRGSYAAIGVGTKKAKLQTDGYVPLLGADEHSFGWDIVSRKCRHAGQEWDYPTGMKAKRAMGPLTDRLFVILDCQKGTLAFATQSDHLGIAFRDLPTAQSADPYSCPPLLFPMVAAVWGNATITLRYLGSSVEVNCEEFNDELAELS